MKETHMTLVYDGNEGRCIRSRKVFDSYPPIIQLDLLNDWIVNLCDLYDEIMDEGVRKEQERKKAGK